MNCPRYREGWCKSFVDDDGSEVTVTGDKGEDAVIKLKKLKRAPGDNWPYAILHGMLASEGQGYTF